MTGRNQLAGETSPYLQQHRNNPVHWHPWGQVALDSANRDNKPILLSIGYSACHWCHVMAHECFEDEEVASVMNSLFVNIKVDREERPDIDQIYMAALNATGEQGGWPLTMFLTPDGRPFWGGTYFPKQPRYGRPGFIQVMQSVHQAWMERRADIDSGATELTNHVAGLLSATQSPSQLSVQPAVELGKRISELIDPDFGGISGAPKFPNAPYMTTLWLSGLETADSAKLQQVTDSLEKMLAGGIYDHVGGGLCRYSTDAEWIIPHFEKMLYDNAQLIELCVLAHGSTRNELFRNRIEDTIDWLEREMLLDNGAFASSLDADSEGEEGKFYVWTAEEITSVLGNSQDDFFISFELVKPPSWEGDPVIVRKSANTSSACRNCVDTLRQHRQSRIRPGLDNKVLTDWNGLVIHAIALAARHFDSSSWLALAERAFKSVCEQQDKAGRLPHSVNGGSKLFPALSQDYAAMINAAISLYQSSHDTSCLDQARQWAETLNEDYGDGQGGYFLTASSASDVLLRIRGDIDEATPSATAQITTALVRLAAATGSMELHDQAYSCARSALGRALRQSHGQAGIFNSVYLAISQSKLVIVDDPQNATLTAVAKTYPDPRRIDVTLPIGSQAEASLIPGPATLDTANPGAWLCTGQTCLPPVTTASELEALLLQRFVTL